MNGHDLPTDLLRTFATVSAERGFTQAARVLGLTQPAVSQQIQRLESQTGCQLVERNSTGVRLTGSGEVLLGYARHMLRLSDEVRERLRAPDLKGRVRFGVTEHAVERLPELLGRFARAHPDVRLEVDVDHSSRLVERTRLGELDLALVSEYSLDRGPHQVVWSEPLRWMTCCADLTPVYDDVLPLVVFSPTCRLRELAIDQLDRIERKWRVAITSSSLTGIRAAVAAGLGVAILMEGHAVDGLSALGREAGLPELPSLSIVMIRRDAGLSPAAVALHDFLDADLADLGAVQHVR